MINPMDCLGVLFYLLGKLRNLFRVRFQGKFCWCLNFLLLLYFYSKHFIQWEWVRWIFLDRKGFNSFDLLTEHQTCSTRVCTRVHVWTRTRTHGVCTRTQHFRKNVLVLVLMTYVLVIFSSSTQHLILLYVLILTVLMDQLLLIYYSAVYLIEAIVLSSCN